MRLNKTHLSIKSSYPLRGLDTYIPSTMLDTGLSPQMNNVLATKGTILTRAGYSELGTSIVDIDAAAITDVVVALFEFETLTDTRWLVAITTKRQYRYDAAAGEWDDITALGTTHTIDDTDSSGNTFTISGEGDLSAEFPDDDTMVVSGTATNDGTYKIVGTTWSDPDFIIEVDNVTTSSETGSVAVHQEWTGDETDYVDWALGTDNSGRRVFVTNGKDTPVTWDGTGNFALFQPTYTNFVTCKTFEIFFDTLLMGNITTTSSEPQLIAWSDIAEFDEFESGSAGFNLIADSQGPIKKLLRLGDRLSIYSDNSIGVVTNVGGTSIFSFEQLIQNTRLLSPRTIVSLGPYHLYASQENIYLFDGSRMVRPIGDPIHKTYRQEISLENAVFSHAFADIVKNTVFWTFPLTETSSVVYTCEYNIYDINRIDWSRSEYAHRPTSRGFFSRDSDLTWDSAQLVGLSWNDMSDAWIAGSFRADFPVRVFGSSGKIFLDDGAQRSDDGEIVEFRWDSKDFVLPEAYESQHGRWTEVEIELRGSSVDVSYSLDQGQTFTLQETLTLTSQWAMYKVYVDVSSRTFRFSLAKSGDAEWCEMRFFNVWVRPTSPR